MIDKIKEYLKSAAGLKISAVDVRDSLRLTPMVASLYDFFKCDSKDVSFVVVIERDDAIIKPTPAAIAAHLSLVAEQLNGAQVIYAAKRIVSYNRLRLLERHIPFVVPGRQLYLPFLNMMLSEIGAKKEKHFESLGVLAQMLLIGYLNQKHEGVSILEATTQTGYTRISVMKAFDELEFFGLALRDKLTHKLVFRQDRKRVFEEAKPLMRNPKRRELYVDSLPRGLLVVRAGTDALSDISMIAPGNRREYAALSSDVLKLKDVIEVPRSSASIKIELWHYNPAFIYGDRIDPLSLCLSLANERDDRVKGEVEEVLEGFKW